MLPIFFLVVSWNLLQTPDGMENVKPSCIVDICRCLTFGPKK